MHRGYIKIWRKLRDSFLWEDLSGIKLWLHLLMEANHSDKEHFFNNEKIIIKRGQLICGRQALEKELGIDESKIYRLLTILEKEQLIEQQKNNRYTIISILNYKIYQDNEQQTEQPVNNQRTTSEQPVNTPKYIKNTLRRIKESDDNSIKNPEIKLFIDYWFNKYQLKTGHKYVVHGSKEGQIVKNLLKTLPIEELKARADKFFDSEDKFIQEAGYTIGVFSSQINKLNKKEDIWRKP